MQGTSLAAAAIMRTTLLSLLLLALTACGSSSTATNRDGSSEFSDAGIADVAREVAVEEGKAPGVVNCVTTNCASPSVCCSSGPEGQCVSADNGPGSCYGGSGLLASCDGAEDCPSAKVCCLIPSPYPVNPGPPTVGCATLASCNNVICRGAGDCPSSAPVCCKPHCDPGTRCAPAICKAGGCG